jgi:chromosome segregation protein
MRLEKVEIVGFKSFCDKQELSFQGGVTGIVGPNGCGKSNISDAISWVLGEQSAKSLRGSSMEDVIFAGSQARQPVGLAEVSLRVSGLNGNSPDGSPECVITRRLYRNGDSEYLMNDRACRLRDIHELFMDTGLGSKAYSIIEQGKIGQILSTKPADRRALIEEAAGITKYKARRRQTALKLEAAQQNLLRVNDIVGEVEKQLDSLKRQAGKARRYRTLREALQGVERVLYGRRYLDLEAGLRGLVDRIATEEERERAASLALETEEAHLEARRVGLYDEEARLEAVRARLNELTLAVDRHQGRAGYCKEQIAEAESRAAEAAREVRELELREGPLSEALAVRRGDEQRVNAERDRAEDEAGRADAVMAEAAARQAGLESEQDAARDAQVGLLGRLAALQNARESVAGNAERASSDLVKLAAERQELEREVALTAAARERATAQVAEAEALQATLAGARDAALARADAARAQALEIERRLDLLQSERDGLGGRLSSLVEIVSTHSAFDEGVRALLARPEGFEPLAVVADLVETESAHERAVEAFLTDRLQAVVVSDAAQAARGLRYLESTEAGRATLLPLDQAAVRSDASALGAIAETEPACRGRVSELYRVAGPLAKAVRAALPDALVTESLDEALVLASRHPDVPFVTLRGEVASGGFVRGGRGVRGLLAPRREVREISARLAVLEVELAQLRQRAAEEAISESAAEVERRTLEARTHGVEKELVALRHSLAAADEESQRLERKAAVLDSERRQAEQERGTAAVRLAEIEQGLQAGEAERVAGSAHLQSLAAMLAEARTASEVAQVASSEARSRLAALRERAAAVEAEARRLEADHRELRERIAAATSRGDEMAQRRAELATELAESERLLAESLQQRDRSTGEVAVAEDRVRGIRAELDALEHSLKERRRERETLRDALSELTVSRARTESDLDHLARECHQAVCITAAEAATTLSDEDRLRETSELVTRAEELRQKIDRMGPVNVLAVEQAQELEERHRFLTVQRQDLVDSIKELDDAIKKIDRSSRERFKEAFQIINEHFGQIFKQLFGGGTAGLSLIDEEDILESGIDVMAQPPGKRLQSVMLLSGGEKALTAIALLFAIFQYKPSPFCILDEVDAPLDDANIGRFVRMLDGLKAQTQFVLITHSRRTMEIADQLYGVTMEEPGVSKLVSVRFQ